MGIFSLFSSKHQPDPPKAEPPPSGGVDVTSQVNRAMAEPPSSGIDITADVNQAMAGSPPSVDITAQVNRDASGESLMEGVAPTLRAPGQAEVNEEAEPTSQAEPEAKTHFAPPFVAGASFATKPTEAPPDIPATTAMQSGIRLKQPSDEPPPETMAIPPSGVEAIEGAAAAPPSSVPPISRTPSGEIEISGKAMNAASEFPIKSIKTAPNQASVQFGPNDEVVSNPDNVLIGEGDQPLADGEGEKKAA